MRAKLAPADRMTIDEFLAYMDTRPDGERWELIEGAAVMNAAPTQWHQRVTLNIASALDTAKLSTNATWTAILGVGTHVPISPNSLPQPDLSVHEGPLVGAAVTSDAIVIFEVLSKSNTRADQAWRKRVYASVPNCQHYVTVAMKSAEIWRYDRADGWAGTMITGLDATLALPAIAVEIPLRDIYRWTAVS